MVWKCDACGEEFGVKEEAIEHEKNCNQKNICYNCGKRFGFLAMTIKYDGKRFHSIACKNRYMQKIKDEKEKHVKEYKRKCKECGKVWHSLVSREEKIVKDMKTNRGNQVAAGLGMCGGSYDALGAATQTKRNIEANETELDRLRKCPICSSTNYQEEIIVYEKE